MPYHHWLFTGESISKVILQLADAQHADLIIIGTHGRSGLSRLLTGSVAEAVIRHARCPVLTVKDPTLKMVEAIPGFLPS